MKWDILCAAITMNSDILCAAITMKWDVFCAAITMNSDILCAAITFDCLGRCCYMNLNCEGHVCATSWEFSREPYAYFASFLGFRGYCLMVMLNGFFCEAMFSIEL